MKRLNAILLSFVVLLKLEPSKLNKTNKCKSKPLVFLEICNTCFEYCCGYQSNLHFHFQLVIHFGASKTPELKCALQEMHSADASANTSPVRNLRTLHIPESRISADQRSTCVTQARDLQAPLSVPDYNPASSPPQLINSPCFLAQLISSGECLLWGQPAHRENWDPAHSEASSYFGHQQQGVFIETK